MNEFSAISWRDQATFRSGELLSSFCIRLRLSEFALMSHYLQENTDIGKSIRTLPFPHICHIKLYKRRLKADSQKIRNKCIVVLI